MQTIDITKMVYMMTTGGIAKGDAMVITEVAIHRYYSLRPVGCCGIDNLQSLLNEGKLAAMFTWSESPEGHDYWESIYYKMKRC